jgi:hypothetical protein
LRNRATVLIALFSSGLFAQTVRVPFVGCPADGQVGPVEAPKGSDQVVQVPKRAAQRLAYYQAFGYGVLAPRGWYCFGTYGSGGSTLFMSSLPIKGTLNQNPAGLAGPAEAVSRTDGGTGGRFEVAQVIARVFPARKAYVEGVASEVEPAIAFTFGPYPGDKLIVQTDRLVQFQTASHSEGLGTMSRLKADDDPIEGVAILEGKTPDLLMLRVRLPRELRDLAPVIIQDLLVRQRGDAR